MQTCWLYQWIANIHTIIFLYLNTFYICRRQILLYSNNVIHMQWLKVTIAAQYQYCRIRKIMLKLSWYRPSNALFDTIFVIWLKMGKLLLISVHDKPILPFLGIIGNQHITGWTCFPAFYKICFRLQQVAFTSCIGNRKYKDSNYDWMHKSKWS